MSRTCFLFFILLLQKQRHLLLEGPNDTITISNSSYPELIAGHNKDKDEIKIGMLVSWTITL